MKKCIVCTSLFVIAKLSLASVLALGRVSLCLGSLAPADTTWQRHTCDITMALIRSGSNKYLDKPVSNRSMAFEHTNAYQHHDQE